MIIIYYHAYAIYNTKQSIYNFIMHCYTNIDAKSGSLRVPKALRMHCKLTKKNIYMILKCI